MRRVELAAYRVALREGLARLDAVTVACATCAHWDDRCVLADAVPPAEVQREGCDEWELDGVPF